jgi:hypothetical protein
MPIASQVGATAASSLPSDLLDTASATAVFRGVTY